MISTTAKNIIFFTFQQLTNETSCALFSSTCHVVYLWGNIKISEISPF